MSLENRHHLGGGGGFWVNGHIVLGLLETASFNGILGFESWVDIQGRGGVGLMVLAVEGEYL